MWYATEGVHLTFFEALSSPWLITIAVKPAIYMDSGLSFDASSEVFGGEDLALVAGGGRARRTGRYI